jgi:hypothetical protein
LGWLELIQGWVNDIVTSIEQWANNVIETSPILAGIDTVGDFLVQNLSWVYGLLVSLAPVLPMIVMFYIIDVALTSAHEGSFHPIGNMVMRIYEMGAQVLTMIASGVDAVIPF